MITFLFLGEDSPYCARDPGLFVRRRRSAVFGQLEFFLPGALTPGFWSGMRRWVKEDNDNGS